MDGCPATASPGALRHLPTARRRYAPLNSRIGSARHFDTLLRSPSPRENDLVALGARQRAQAGPLGAVEHRDVADARLPRQLASGVRALTVGPAAAR